MSFVIRWGLIGLGGFMVYGGVNEALTGGGMNEEAELTQPDALGALAESGERRYVRVVTGVDASKAVFETGLSNPATTRVPTHRVYDLPSPSGFDWGDAQELVGSVVRYDGAAHAMRVTVEEVMVERGETVEEGETRSVRLVGMAADGPGRLFLVSPRFSSESDPGYQAWLESDVFWGKACRTEHLDDNLNLQRPIREVMDLFRQNGVMVEPSSLAVLTREGAPAPYNGAAYAPLIGSAGEVLVRFHAEELDGLGAGFHGIAEPASAASIPGAREAVPGLPSRIVVLDTSRTGADVNRKSRAGATMGVVFGAGMLGLGGLWVGAIRAAKRREQARVESQLRQLRMAQTGVEANGRRRVA